LHLGPRVSWKPGNGRDGKKLLTAATNQAHYRGVWVIFQGIRIDTKQAGIQKLRALGISSEERWRSDEEFLTHRLKSGKMTHTTITVRLLPNEPFQIVSQVHGN